MKKNNSRKQRPVMHVDRKHLIKSCKKKNKLFVTNEEWPDISEEKLKYFLEEYGKISSIKT